jgi:signal transduction histidine kinase/CheY-like chemotaxis protein/HAMP domain-containing protein
MLNLNQLKIGTKLRILSLVTLISMAALGFISNYFFQTSKVLGIMINGERIHNTTFQKGVENYYKYLSTDNLALLDTAVTCISDANQMVYNFSIIDQLLKLPEEKYIEILFGTFKEAFNYNKENAYLMSSRTRLFLALKSDKFVEAQQVTMKGYLLGEQLKKRILDIKKDSSIKGNDIIGNDFQKMEVFYKDFATIMSSINDFASNLLILSIFIIVITFILLLWIISVLISRSIVIPLNTMVNNFQVIARGNLNTELPIYSKTEIGLLADSFREIQRSLRTVIDYTKKVAEGDYSQQIEPRSAEDELIIALNKMVNKLVNDSWFKSGINQVNEKLNGDHNLDELSTNTLEFMISFLHSQLGSIHLYDTDFKFLKLVASSGFDTRKLKEQIVLNEGILGQVAMKKKMMILSDIPSEAYVTFSTTGSYIPKQVVVAPLVYNDLLIGVIELASVYNYTELEIEFLEEAAGIIAINIYSAINLIRTNELLQKTQEQAGELQVQQEELRVMNEELTEHTKVLTESEKILQVQQEELRVANEELEERTRQLEIQKEDIGNKNTELTEIKNVLESKAKQLVLSSNYKSEFLANMSHELRTPLNSLLILSNLLANNKKGNLTPDQVKSAQIIYKSGNDLLYLINEVLDLSKIEAGKMVVEFGLVNSADIREELLSNFNAIADDKHLVFEVSIEKGFPNQIETDRYRLMQIIRNLLSNAFKFTNKGKVIVEFMIPPPSVKLNLAHLNFENSCCIRVEDSGVGIPDEKLEAIFEAFQQADGSISRKFGGTGLGLSISRELIKMLGGEIQLESRLNQGSVFFIYLPIRQLRKSIQEKEQAQNDSSLKKAEPVFAKDISSNSDETVLPWFVSDDRREAADNQIVMIIHPSKQQAEKFREQVRMKHYKVIVASSIPDAILLAEKYHPRAIILAVELTNDTQSYLLLKSHPLIRKLPMHIITPIEFGGSSEENELKTLETMDISEALRSIDNDFISYSKRILVVEDDSSTRKIVKELLSDLDIYIQEAAFAEEAFQILSTSDFDCIILDLGLPDYNGKELLEKLKINHIAIPKVIIYTGKEISKEEHKKLSEYTDTIILKGLKSDERLTDEVTLFLHQVSKTVPEQKIRNSSLSEDILFRGKRILIVDDEIRNVFALGKMLEEREIEVLEAENGAVAIEVLKANKGIDLVLMDVMMPVMDGYEAMQVIRNTIGIKDIPIICLTAKAMKEDSENALKHGANDYLSKPVNEEKLFAMLKIWLYKK